MKYANQMRIKIIRGCYREKFIRLGEKPTFQAMRDFKKLASFRLYVYLTHNEDGYHLDFSSEHFCKTCGVSYSAYRAAKEELIANGYLKQIKGNNYEFYDDPHCVGKPSADIPKEEWIPDPLDDITV